MAGILERVRGFFGWGEAETLRRQRDAIADRHRELRAKVDAATSHDENKKHWANADGLGPNASLNAGTRAIVRNRSRYECLNNSYAGALVRSQANDLVGTCPRPQVTIPDDDGTLARLVEKKFSAWAKATQFGRKCRLLERCCSRDGDGVAVLASNDDLLHPVKLDLRVMEADQLTSPYEFAADPFVVDGIRFNSFWQPLEYYFLDAHPGESSVPFGQASLRFISVSAAYVLHWFDQDRPGQMRGLPRITAALPLFAQLRRYTLATLTAAEVAAMLAGVLKTTTPPNAVDPSMQGPEFGDPVELVRGALMTLPEGWDATQFEPKQPIANYGEFKRELLNETGRSAGAPLNVVTGNSSGYNYSSGRLDHVPYQRDKRIQRYDFTNVVLDRTVAVWVERAQLVPNYLPELPPFETWTLSWNWDGFDSIDALKDAQADDIRLKNGTSTYSEILASYGQDWLEFFDQLAREKAEAEKRGLPWPVLAEAQPGSATNTQSDMGNRLRSLLEESGVDEQKAEDAVDLLFSGLAKRNFTRHGHVNGHLNGSHK